MSATFRTVARLSLRAAAPQLARSAARPALMMSSRVVCAQVPVGIRMFGDDAGNASQGQVEALDKEGMETPPETRTMFMGNLDFGLTNDDVLKELQHLGEVKNMQRVSRGSFRVVFKDIATCVSAIQQINGSFWRGRRIYAQKSRPPLKAVEEANHSREEPTRTLFIGNIPSDATDLELSEALGRIPSIPFLRLLRDHQSGLFRGFGYADFYTKEEAQDAKEVLSGVSIRGNTLRVNFAKENEKTTQALDRRIATLGLMKGRSVDSAQWSPSSEESSPSEEWASSEPSAPSRLN